MALFGPPNVEKMKAKKNIKGLIKALGYQKDHEIRGAAARSLGKIGDPRAVDPLISALKDEERWVRIRVAEALGQIGEPAVAPLIVALEDSNSDVRTAAADALDRIGWEPDRGVSGAAYWIAQREWDHCVEIGTPAVEPLLAALTDRTKDVRGAAAKALDEIGDAAVEPLLAALTDRTKDVRGAAAGALGRIGDPRAVEPLLAALTDSNSDVRKAAAKALDEIGDARAVDPLIAALKDRSKYVRQAAAEALGKIGDPRAVEKVEELKAIGDALIEALTYEKDEEARKAAASALDELGWKPDRGKAAAALKNALEKGHDETARWLLKNRAVIGEDTVDPEAYPYLDMATLIVLGLDPWWHEDTQERLDLIRAAQEAIRPKGKGFTELLMNVLKKGVSPGLYAEDKALAAIALGILHADFQLFEARGLMERPLFEYKRSIGNQVVQKPLSLYDFRSLRDDPSQGEGADPRVVEALRQALADGGRTTLDPSHKVYPCLDIHLHLYMSTAQARTLARELRKGESKEPFYLQWDRAGVAFAAAFSLVLIGDKKSAKRIVEFGELAMGGSYNRAYFFKLAYDLGFDAVAVELARIYVQNKDISGFFKEFKEGHREGRQALDCLSVMDDLEMLVPALEGDEKNVLQAAIEELKKPG